MAGRLAPPFVPRAAARPMSWNWLCRRIPWTGMCWRGELLGKLMLGVALLAIAVTDAGAEGVIEYRFGGTLTFVDPFWYGGSVQVGDPFVATLLVKADAPDLDSSPQRGRYNAESWVCVSGATEIFAFDRFAEAFVWDNSTSGDLFGGSHFAFNMYAGGGLDFPNHAFVSDRLPMSLDLSQATSAYMQFTYFSVLARGTVASVNVQIVPEPFGAVIAVALCCLVTRRIRNSPSSSR